MRRTIIAAGLAATALALPSIANAHDAIADCDSADYTSFEAGTNTFAVMVNGAPHESGTFGASKTVALPNSGTFTVDMFANGRLYWSGTVGPCSEAASSTTTGTTTTGTSGTTTATTPVTPKKATPQKKMTCKTLFARGAGRKWYAHFDWPYKCETQKKVVPKLPKVPPRRFPNVPVAG